VHELFSFAQGDSNSLNSVCKACYFVRIVANVKGIFGKETIVCQGQIVVINKMRPLQNKKPLQGRNTYKTMNNK
jgi:hypothetical protein